MRWQEYESLRQRVEQFSLLQLPGQPQAMHAGTSYLVSDLWQAVRSYYEQEHPMIAEGQEGEAE